MGRFFVELDPDGYYRTTEPGADFLYYGSTLASKIDSNYSDGKPAVHKLFVPKGSEWIMGRPRQMSPGWSTDDRLSENVLRLNRWTFSPQLSPTEYEPTRTADGATYPDNQWINIPEVPETVAPQDYCDYTAMAAAMGVSLLPDTKTIGWCGDTPMGHNFMTLGYPGITPMFNWLQYPAPRDQFIFGWAQYAVVTRGNSFYLLESPNNDKQNWKLLWHGALGDADDPRGGPAKRFSVNSMMGVSTVRTQSRALLVLPVGWTDLYLYQDRNEPIGVKTREYDPLTTVEPWFQSGPFWVAAAPGQKLSFQSQIVGYEAADSQIVTPTPVFFDLGPYYKPSVAPTFNQHAIVYTNDPIGNPVVAEVEPTNSVYLHETSIAMGGSIRYGMEDENGDTWDFDAADTYRGGIFLQITPGNPASAAGVPSGDSGAFYGPQLRVIEGSFPVVLVERENDPLILTDEEFGPVEVLNFLYDPLGKRITIDLFDGGLGLISANGHDSRANYPIHILEDTDDDNVGDTIRAAGWIKDFDVEELVYNHPVLGMPILVYRLTAFGVMEQANTVWEFLPQIVQPEADPPGTVSHTFAVRRCLNVAGIPANNIDYLNIQTDPSAGEDFTFLPGTWGIKPGEIGRDPDNKWGPTWDDNIAEYLIELGRSLRGWVLYETLGRTIRYHEDLMRDVERGAPYGVSATLYATMDDAVAAGVPKQVYLAGAKRELKEPRANVVRIAGDEESGTIIPQVIERDLLSLTDIDYPHFLGSSKVYAPPPLREVDSLGTARILCRLLVEKLSRRRTVWNLTTKASPWDMLPEAIDVGYVVSATGKGDRLVTHVRWNLLLSSPTDSVVRTDLSLMSLPDNATLGAGSGPYPGSAIPVEE